MKIAPGLHVGWIDHGCIGLARQIGRVRTPKAAHQEERVSRGAEAVEPVDAALGRKKRHRSFGGSQHSACEGQVSLPADAFGRHAGVFESEARQMFGVFRRIHCVAVVTRVESHKCALRGRPVPGVPFAFDPAAIARRPPPLRDCRHVLRDRSR